MLQRRALSGESVYRALTVRKRLSTPLESAVSPIDIAASLSIDVRFVDLPSMEGIYVAGDAPKIILSCLRPQGRRHFTCAHEIGHHEFGHGQQFDEMVDHRSANRRIDPNEYLADCFASYLLMPKTTVDSGMSKRGLSYSSLTPLQAYAMSNWLGVGYRTFVNHLMYGLKVLRREQTVTLLRSSPLKIRGELIGDHITEQLHIVDSSWLGRPIDCEVDDCLLLPKGTVVEGESLAPLRRVDSGDLIRVERPGIARVSQGWPLWSAFVRATRREYVGRSCYRFEEESDE